MKLLVNSTSPYARLTKVVAIEVGLGDHIQYVEVDPWKETRKLSEINPAAKIPALICTDGKVLIESEIICDYLIRFSGKLGMLPEEKAGGTGRLQVLGLARAAMDCALGAVIQNRYGVPESFLSRRWRQGLPQIAKELEKICTSFPDLPRRPDLTDITLAVAFLYATFRLPESGWENEAPGLSIWVKRMDETASFVATRPG